MAYEKHTWVNNEVISAAKMNNIEDGIEEASQSGGGGALICNSSYDDNEGNYILDKTAQEIYDALLAGTPAYIKYQYGTPEDFAGSLYLAPVIKIYNYDYTNTIRICASKPQAIGSISSLTACYSPAVLIYSATGVNEYPVFYTTVCTKGTSVETNGVE